MAGFSLVAKIARINGYVTNQRFWTLLVSGMIMEDGIKVIDRLAWRIQPVRHILKRDERHKDMLDRHRQEKFAEILAAEKKKLRERESNALDR